MIKKFIGVEYIDWKNKNIFISKNDLPCSIGITSTNGHKLYNYFSWHTNGCVYRDNDLIALMYKSDLIRYEKYNDLYKYNGYAIHNKLSNKEYLFTYGVCCKLLKEILYFND